MLTIKGVKMFILCLIAVSLIGCGGGSDGGIEGSGQTVTLKGTVAVGAPIANSDVVIKDNNGKKHTTLTDTNGNYNVVLQDMEPPFLLQVNRASKSPLFSVALEEGVANIHPLSDLVTRNYFSRLNINLEVEFSAVAAISVTPQKQDVLSIVNAVNELMLTAYSEYAVPLNFNFLTSIFSADQTAFDDFLDHLDVTVSDNKVTVNLIDKSTGLLGNVIHDLSLDVDLNAQDNDAPSKPENLLALPASDTEIVLNWTSSTDNIGVSAYNIYRDDSLLTTVALPVFKDTGLVSSTQYCYRVQAIDIGKNTSLKSITVCSTTLAQEDSIAPAPVSAFTSKAISTSDLVLSWNESLEDDVFYYQIFRSDEGEFKQISARAVNGYQDSNLASGLEYCYLIKVVDASGNVSENNQSLCEKTHAAELEPNNSLDEATGSVINGIVEGAFLNDEDVDFFKVEVVDVASFKATIVTTRMISKMFLLDDQGNIVANSGGDMGASIHTVRYDASAGLYYLMIQQESNFVESNYYSLKISLD